MRSPDLPAGQRERTDFPRFGLPRFANRFPVDPSRLRVTIVGDEGRAVPIEAELAALPRVEQCSDFHCVTTWTRRSLSWSGWRFADVYRQIVVPTLAPGAEATIVSLHGQDGYRSSLPLADLLGEDVLLADRLDDRPLSVAHGAPLRLVAPAHYGYKSVKHVDRLEFRSGDAGYRPVGLRFMAHPRARVAEEERGQGVPGWILRYLYRPLIPGTVARFAAAMTRHEAGAE